VESVQTIGQLLGALAMLGAAACYALSSFVVKRRYGHLAAMQTSLVSIAVSAVLSFPFAVATLPSGLPGARALLAVLGLGAVGTALAFVIFYKLINEVGAGRASLVSYLAPGVALFYGALLLDEAITAAAIAGLVLILGGVAIASRKRVTPSRTPRLPIASQPRPPRDQPLRRAA
jgi:drug/metabolite transporter (DMT)-like permease